MLDTLNKSILLNNKQTFHSRSMGLNGTNKKLNVSSFTLQYTDIFWQSHMTSHPEHCHVAMLSRVPLYTFYKSVFAKYI